MASSNGNGARTRAVASKLGTLPAHFVRCRASRHQYGDFVAFQYSHDDGGKHIVVRYVCRRCKFQRWDFYDQRHNFEYSRSFYPDGYLLKWDVDEERTRITTRDATKTLLGHVKILAGPPRT